VHFDNLIVLNSFSLSIYLNFINSY